MRSLVSFIFGTIIGAAVGAYVAKSIAEKRAEEKIAEATIEARDYYKEKFAPKKKEEEKQKSNFDKKDDLAANERLTRIYGRQFELYSEPVDTRRIEEDPTKETYAYEIDEDEFGNDHDYTTYSLDYYADGTMLDETGNVVEDPIHLVGGDVLDGLNISNPTAYVRNDITKTDYEICYIDADYEPEGGVKD